MEGVWDIKRLAKEFVVFYCFFCAVAVAMMWKNGELAGATLASIIDQNKFQALYLAGGVVLGVLLRAYLTARSNS